MKKKHLGTTQVIMLGFLVGALVGSVLLMLPFCQKSGVKIEYIDSLFVAVSAMCVTGLSTLNIGATFSGLGQVVLLLLIQLGGLGLVTFSTMILITFRKKITLQDRMLIQSAYNLDTLHGLVRLTKRIMRVTLCIEGIGAVFYALVLIPEYGVKGIWYSVFTAVSAYCNAGIDLFGGNSLCAYRDNLLINFNTMFLIIAGGLGFPVYWEISRLISEKRSKKLNKPKMSYHARLVIIITAVLIVSGTILTLVLEYKNPDTIGELSFGKKLLSSLFQSVTLRTAGFATIDQGLFRSSSCLAYLFFMFIGGSPAGTAGGVKTMTVMLLFASVVSNIKGKKEVTVMNRKITDSVIRRCVAIIIFSLSVMIILSVCLLAVQELDFLDVLYEMTSAIATVGLSRGMTSNLNVVGKIIVSLAMYLGRIGPITLALAFNTNKAQPSLSYAEGKVIIG